MGGSEIRNLVVHNGKLFAANRYWKDAPGVVGCRSVSELRMLQGSVE
jgi:hypothetical protein